MRGHDSTARADEAALAALVETSSERLLRTAYLLCLDLDLAEDLVVQTWTQVARHWSGVATTRRAEVRALQTLVAAAVHAQEQRGVRRSEREDPSPSPSLVGRRGAVALQQVEDRLEVEFALVSLAPRQRAVLVLRYHEGLTDQETAEALGCSIAVVRCTTHHVVHLGESTEDLLTETFTWQARAVDADRVDAVVSREYDVAAAVMRRTGVGALGRWLGRVWLARVARRDRRR